MKLTAKLAELRIDIGDGAIDDHFVAGVGRHSVRTPRRRSSNNCVYDGFILAHRWARKTALRPHPSAWIESQGPNGARASGTGRVVITQIVFWLSLQRFDNPLPYRANH
ncbi:hypothetical protein NKH82_29555 [Mesorhizobium sp. M0915]|uniref:hypothetical protein n=1 Tax=Mesorhizobium sp. M0915 TaxID=2957027 RepID=UPI00333A5D9C